MPERIEFRFDGQLSAEHLMDFYEAGRFQYGAARLLVKLDQFRRTGRFSQKITYGNNTRITLEAQEPGSFVIGALAPLANMIAEAFVAAPVSLLWSYVVDRIVKPASDDNLREALATNREMLGVFQADIAEREDRTRRTLDLLENRIARGDDLTEENRQLHERLLAETERRAYLEGEAAMLRRISIEQDTKLVSMAAPLLRDMGVALRSSASTLRVATEQGPNRRRMLFLNRQMASEIETSLIDEESTLLLVKIVQYNTETGWGKLRMQEHEGLLSFNVPSDVKGELQRPLTAAMNEQETYIECVFVRSSRGIRQRAIVLAIRDLDEIEWGR
jgi:anion-transporting  ArsA/GET3 family ATPase